MDITKCLGVFCVIGSIILMLLLSFKKIERFFNIREIIVKQLSLFKSCKSQYFVFYILPLFLAIGLTLLSDTSDKFYSDISVFIGIVVSIMCAILAILTGNDYSMLNEKKRKNRLIQVVLQTTNAIIFNSLLCVILLMNGIIFEVCKNINLEIFSTEFILFIRKVLSCMSYYLFIVILLLLMLIIKHMCKIIEFNLKIENKT